MVLVWLTIATPLVRHWQLSGVWPLPRIEKRAAEPAKAVTAAGARVMLGLVPKMLMTCEGVRAEMGRSGKIWCWRSRRAERTALRPLGGSGSCCRCEGCRAEGLVLVYQRIKG